MSLLLVLGPTGVGKSSLIQALVRMDARFVYMAPETTRPLREGESDKTHVSHARLEEGVAAGEYLVVNDLYAAKYATPRAPIDDALAHDLFPVIDWPVTRLDVMRSAYPNQTVACYLQPESLDALVQRLVSRGAGAERAAEATEEWTRSQAGEFNQQVDFWVVNSSGELERAAREVYSGFLGRSC